MSSSTQNVKKIDARLLVDGDINNTSGLVNGRHIANDGAAQDAHIADDTLHRVINDSGTGSTDIWSASKIATELATKAATVHTHTSSQITDLSTSTVTEGSHLYYTSARAQADIDSRRGAANGVASLNASGKIPTSELELNGSVNYQATWNAATNSPALTNGGGGAAQKGFYYIVSTAGTTDVDGETDWEVGDWIISSGAAWQKSDHTDAVSMVCGKKGAVVLDTDDITEATNLYWTDTRFDTRLATKSTTNLTEGTNLYYTEARVTANTAVAAATAHAADATKHRVINDSGTGVTDLWSASKITSALSSVTGAGHTHTSSEITDLTTTITTNAAVAAATAHAADATKHRVINDAGTGATELWSASKINSTKADKSQLCQDEATALFFDDFIGDGLSQFWSASWTSGSNSAITHIDGVGGILQLSASPGAYAELKMVRKQVAVVPDSRLKFRVRLNQTADARVEFGARVDVSEGMYWIYDPIESPNWQMENNLAASNTNTNSGVAADTTWHIFEIVTRAADIRFFLDGTLKATHTTNKPTAVMNLYARQTALGELSTVDCNIDYVKFTSDRDGSGGGSDGGGDTSCTIC